jgi:hemerythrin superfamily protein
MDAITLLRNDHKTVEQLFKRFEKAGDGALVEKREIVDRIVEELSIHATIEEQLFYPVARATVPGTEDIALESLEEHHIVKWVLSELDGMDPAAERFDAKVTVLIENVRHHVEEEEGEFFPKVRDELGRKALGDLGEALEEAKSTAPTHPHPRSPDTPPSNRLVGAIAGVIDRLTDNVSGVTQGSVSAVEDLIATVLHNKKPKTSPTGSTVARKRARAVRKTAASATDGVAKTVRSAGSGAVATTRAAKAGAKGTITSAKKSAAATRTTAKRAATTTAHTATKATKATAATAKRSASKTAAAARSGR